MSKPQHYHLATIAEPDANMQMIVSLTEDPQGGGVITVTIGKIGEAPQAVMDLGGSHAMTLISALERGILHLSARAHRLGGG